VRLSFKRIPQESLKEAILTSQSDVVGYAVVEYYRNKFTEI